MPAPDVAIVSVEIHANSLPTFVPKFGKRVKAAGGTYSECRGDSRHRFVRLPWGARDLIDEIARTHNDGPKTTLIVREFASSDVADGRLNSLLGVPTRSVYKWLRAGPASATEFLESSVLRVVAAVDWRSLTSQWNAEDARHAKNSREHSLRLELQSLRERIASESVRILDGANDLDPLRELASAYRAACEELGIEIAEASPAPAP